MRILLFIINIILFGSTQLSFGQNKLIKNNKKDSIQYRTGYGLRVGIDISKPIISSFDKSYNGLELVGDYRITKRWYLATELGYENERISEDFFNSSIKGSYFKAGTNFNTYNNWLDMNNEIYLGARYGFSAFKQTLTNYTPNAASNYFPSENIISGKSEDLTTHWLELQLGIKVETFKNLFVGFHGSYKIGVYIEDSENLSPLYAPGFNRIFSSNTGFGFNYTISYLIPFSKK